MHASNEDRFNELVTRVETSFKTQFGSEPRWIAAAPGRVNLIGEHTDYNEGFVLPMAIERDMVLAASELESSRGEAVVITLHSENLNDTQTLKIENGTIEKAGNWTDYIAGVFAGFLRRGCEFNSLNIAVEGDVPIGGGLSSSAALEVSTATLLEAISGKKLNASEKVLLCQKAEHDYAGVPCGIMDQFASVNGKKDNFLLLDCQSETAELVPFKHPDYSIFIIDSNVKHSLASGEYGKRRAECEQAAEILGLKSLREASMASLELAKDKMDARVFRRARHVIGEINRTQQAAIAMQSGKWETLGELMLASHASLRDDYEVSCKELDILVELMMDIGASKGVIGSRMTGGGFGGCTVSIVPRAAVENIISEISARYTEKTGISAAIFTSRPAEGARMIKV